MPSAVGTRAVGLTLTRLEEYARRGILAIVGLLGAALFAATATGFAATALWVYTDERLGPVDASLVVAAASAAVAAILAIAAQRSLSRRRRRPPAEAVDAAALARAVAAHPTAAMVEAVAAGLVAGLDRNG